MYEDIVKEMKDKMAPIAEMAEINKKTAEEIMSLQSEYFSELVTSGMSQFKSLIEVKEPKEAVELQMKYYRELESKTTSTAEKELAALSSAKDQMAELVEKNFFDMSDMSYFKDMGKFDLSAFDISKYMPDFAKPATGSTSKAKSSTSSRSATPKKTAAAAS